MKRGRRQGAVEWKGRMRVQGGGGGVRPLGCAGSPRSGGGGGGGGCGTGRGIEESSARRAVFDSPSSPGLKCQNSLVSDAMTDLPPNGDIDPRKAHSRRTFIKGVIAAGAVATTASYLFRDGALLGRRRSPDRSNGSSR